MTIFCSSFVVHSFFFFVFLFFSFSNCLIVFPPLYIFLLIIVSLCIGCMFCFVWFPCVRPYFPIVSFFSSGPCLQGPFVHPCTKLYKYEKHFPKMYGDVGMAVPKTTQTRYMDGSV